MKRHIRKTTFGTLVVGATFTCSRPEGVWQPEVYVKTGADCAGTTSEPVEPVVVRERLLVYALPLPWRVFGMHGWWYIHRPGKLSMRIGPVGHRRVGWHARAQRMCWRHNRGEHLYVFVTPHKFRPPVVAPPMPPSPKKVAPTLLVHDSVVLPPVTRAEMERALEQVRPPPGTGGVAFTSELHAPPFWANARHFVVEPPTRVEMQQQLDWMYDQGLLGAALPRPPAEMVGAVPSEEPVVEQVLPPYLRHNPK